MRSLTVANIRGIDVRIHPSFVIVPLWVIYHFGFALDQGPLGAGYGLLLMLAIFACVVAHEFGHCLMALEHGVRVRNITVFPFGGAAFIEQMPMRPRSEVAITMAGPAVNLAIALVLLPLLAMALVLRGFPSEASVDGLLTQPSFAGALVYLFLANAMIVAFNLLPAFPMDGGRLFRAGLTPVIGRERATISAIGIGVIVALAIFVLGLFWREFILPAIAIFVIVAAYGEGKSVRLESAMRRLRVGQFALWDSGGISASQPLNAALRGGPRDMVVTERGHVVGMLWRRDVLSALNGGASNRTVADVMDDQVFPVDVDDSVYDVQQRMTRLNRWAVPVTEHGVYRGIFTSDRLVHVYRYLNEHSPERRFAGMAAEIGSTLRGGTR